MVTEGSLGWHFVRVLTSSCVTTFEFVDSSVVFKDVLDIQSKVSGELPSVHKTRPLGCWISGTLAASLSYVAFSWFLSPLYNLACIFRSELLIVISLSVMAIRISRLQKWCLEKSSTQNTLQNAHSDELHRVLK